MAVNNKVFADTNYFVALYNPLDTNHQRARAYSQKIAKGNSRVMTSNYTILEVLTILSQRVSRQAAIRLGKQLMAGKYVQIIHVNEKLHNLTWKIFREIRNKNTSFVDCSILVVMKTEGIKKLLTFDTTDFSPLAKKFKFSLF